MALVVSSSRIFLQICLLIALLVPLACSSGGDDTPPPGTQPPPSNGGQGGSQFTVPTTRQGPFFGSDAQTPTFSHSVDSVALSADGTTLLLGGPFDSGAGVDSGAAWVFTRTNGVWTQQGPKLIGADAVRVGLGGSLQGQSVSLSADGNTALVGGPADNAVVGAAWVYTRTGGVWTQQGPKLVGTDAVGQSAQGFSVALSADGNIAAIGARSDNELVGAVWIFTRAGGVWTEQAKLIATGNAGRASIGLSVALNNDGTTLVAGGPEDNTNIGAVWVFTRNGNVWTQQGSKLVGTGALGPLSAGQGTSVALSADGNTLVTGAPFDNEGSGAAWVFTRTAGVWSQQGPKLVANDAVLSDPRFFPLLLGNSVAVSDDGNVALISGPGDNDGAGAIWFFTRTAGVWAQQGSKIVNRVVSLPTSVALNADASTAAVADGSQAWVYVP